jgi:hypothetical protein
MQAQTKTLAQLALMAHSQGSRKSLSAEEFVHLYQRNGCYKCGATASSGQRFMVCGGCEGPSYCS